MTIVLSAPVQAFNHDRIASQVYAVPALSQPRRRLGALAVAEDAETERGFDRSIRDARRTLRELQRSLEIERNYSSQTERGLTTRTPQ